MAESGLGVGGNPDPRAAIRGPPLPFVFMLFTGDEVISNSACGTRWAALKRGLPVGGGGVGVDVIDVDDKALGGETEAEDGVPAPILGAAAAADSISIISSSWKANHIFL